MISHKRRHRRGYLLVGVATAALTLLFVPLAATGADGQSLILGASNEEAHQTFLAGPVDGPLLQLQNTGSGNGIVATATNVGLTGMSPTRVGVFGMTQGSIPFDNSEEADSVGVAGLAANPAGGTGVVANALGKGADGLVAIVGQPDATGTAITARAGSDASTAVDVQGHVKFSSAQTGLIPAGQSRVTVEPRPTLFNEGDMVLVTLQNNPSAKNKAVFFSHIEPNYQAHSFDVVLSGQAGRDTMFAYFVISASG